MTAAPPDERTESHTWGPGSGFERLVAALEAHDCGPLRAGKVRCPAHDDRNPSLSVSKGEKGALLRCFAGCKTDDVLGALGLEPSALFDAALGKPAQRINDARRIVAAYDYTDERGVLLFQVLRYEPKDFRQRRPDGAGGWEWKLGKTRRLLYRLPDVLRAVAAGDRVYIAEGEKDADAGWAAGIVATTNAGGAGKWRREYAESLRGAEVVIVQDRDEPGRKHALDVVASLRGIARSVEIREAKAGKDLADHLAAGLTVDELAQTPADLAGQLRVDEDLTERPTDLGNARRLVRLHGADLRYQHGASAWLVWDGRRWATDDTGEVVRRAKATVATIYAEASKASTDRERMDVARWATRSEARERIAAMLDLARSEPGIPVRAEDLDRDPYALNVLNGTLDLRMSVRRPHRREDLLTKLAPVEYDANARSELWEQFLKTAIPDVDARRFAQKAAGYSLLGRTGADIFLVVHGPPRTGKGTFQEALASTLGDYAATAGLEDFAERKGGNAGPRPELVRLQGARLVSIYETSKRLRLSASLVKTLTGSDPITVRDLYAKPVTFRPQFTLWLATNHLPRLPDDDGAIWERVRELPFTTVIPEEKRDPKVRAELSNPKSSGAAILAWAVEGCRAYLEEGLQSPDLVRKATADYREAMNPLRDFFEACCAFGTDLWVRSADLSAAYETWCKESGEKRITDFNERLRARGCEPGRRHSGRGWKGIGLLEIQRSVTP